MYNVSLHNVGDLDFDLSRSLKVKCDAAVGLPIYDLVLMSNGNNMTYLGSITKQNSSKFEM